MRAGNGWIACTASGGGSVVRKRGEIIGVRAIPCDEPTHPIHFYVDDKIGYTEVTHEEALAVCAEIGIDPSFLAITEKAITGPVQ
jgi:hypothetical protein